MLQLKQHVMYVKLELITRFMLKQHVMYVTAKTTCYVCYRKNNMLCMLQLKQHVMHVKLELITRFMLQTIRLNTY